MGRTEGVGQECIGLERLAKSVCMELRDWSSVSVGVHGLVNGVCRCGKVA